MTITHKYWCVLLLFVTPLLGHAQTVLSSGQVSFIELSFNNLNPSNPFWIVQINDETSNTLYDPTYNSGLGRFVFDTNGGASFLIAGPQHLFVRPLPVTWDFIGTPAGSLFRATPQNGDPSTRLVMGISTINLGSGLFVNDQISITMSITGITNPGQFSVYTNDDTFNNAVGDPNIVTPVLSTQNNITSLLRSTGTSNFFNTGFSAPGFYDVDFQFSGTRTPTAGGGDITSGWYRYRFEVAAFAVPEPATWALIGFSAIGLLIAWRYNRLKLHHALDKTI